MTPGAVLLLDHWASAPGFRDLTVREAGRQLQQLLPSYPHPADQPVATCVNGYRWFGSEMEAVADAIYRAAQRPHRLDETLAGRDWDVELNGEGRWAVPGRCSAHAHSGRASDSLHTA